MSVIKNDKRAVQIIMSPRPEAEDAKKYEAGCGVCVRPVDQAGEPGSPVPVCRSYQGTVWRRQTQL